MRIAIRILITLWMSTLCLSSYAAPVGGLAGEQTASALLADAGVAAKKKPAGKKDKKKRKQQAPLPAAEPAPQLTPEQQRKFDYYYLEASRLKLKKNYAAAMELIEHCLAINPCAPAALYEKTQYCLYLKQTDRALATLEKAVRYAPDNYWYSQALSNLYMQQDSVAKAADLLEQMSLRFTDKLDPLYNLLEIYNREEDYQQVITTLDRIEARIGKNEQITMEKFRIYLQMKDNKRAFREIESLVAEYPKDYRYQGWMYGVGVGYGYQWILSPRWSIEAEIGAGYVGTKYEQYECERCGELIDEGFSNRFSLTKLSVSLIFMLF